MKNLNVYIKLPKVGLGNLLLIWARAAVFCHINQLKFVTSGWAAIRWGAWVRNENKKRVYWNYFKEENLLNRIYLQAKLLFVKPVVEPAVNNVPSAKDQYFLFNKLVTSDNLFGPIRPYRHWVKEELFKMLAPKMMRMYDQCEVPVISIHIRRGDFKIANTLTPIEYFIEAINLIREINKETLPVLIFSDAHEAELDEILKMEEVRMASKKPDILDILQMSNSQYLVLSLSSTFSYWAAFLSSAFAVFPYDDWQTTIRDDARFPEFKFDHTDRTSIETLRTMLCQHIGQKCTA